MSLVAGVPATSVLLIASALKLEPAKDAATDEVRFENVPDDRAIELDLGDFELGAAASGAVEGSPSAEQLSKMTAAGLFVDVSKEALASLAQAAELVSFDTGAPVFGLGDEADALYVIVEGAARVEIPVLEGGGVELGEGQVFGEACLLERGVRQADVCASGRLVTLRIAKAALDDVVRGHPPVGDVLFDLLLQRLVANTLQTSELFAAFDAATQKELARLFEVRRAPAGVVVIEFGKRSDGLYMALAGDLEVDDALGTREVPLGSMFGQESLLSQAPARRTVRALTEAVLLRLPAKRFGTFAAQYPPALAHLSELASRPL